MNYDNLDPDAVRLAQAIRQGESNNNPNPAPTRITQTEGSVGGFQFIPATFKTYGDRYLQGKDLNGNKLDINNPEHQNLVAYSYIKDKKDQGYGVDQIALSWNHGEGNIKKDYNQIEPWKNTYGNTADPRGYVNKIVNNYTQLKNQNNNQQSPQDNTNNPQETGLASQLKGRATDIMNVLDNTASGKINPISGVLQGVGALAGGLGDVVGNAVELIPGVKSLENIAGVNIAKLAQTETGQRVINQIQQFRKDNPELSDDIGAGFNIITAIPILKGIGLVGNITLDAGSLALKSFAEKSALKGLATLGVDSATAGTMVRNTILPDIVNGKYVIDSALNKVEQGVANGTISVADANKIKLGLSNIAGQEAKAGITEPIVRSVATVGGEYAGQALGLPPLVGAYVSRTLEEAIAKKLISRDVAKSLLERIQKSKTPMDIIKAIPDQKVKGLLLTALAAQRNANPSNQ